MAINEINEAGGVLGGRKFTFVQSDTKSEAAEGARAGQEVIGDGADLMIVSCDYDMGAAAATVANSNNMVVISLCASDAKMGVQGIGPYAFTMSNSSLTSGAVIAEWAYNNKGWRTAYNLLDTSIEYDKTICAGFKTRFEKLGGTMHGEDTFKQDDASIASQITRFKQVAAEKGEPDLLHVCSYGAGANAAIRQIRAAGIDTPLSGGDSMDGDYWTEAIGNLNDHYTGTYGSVFGDDPRPRVNEFFDRYEAVHGERVCCSFALSGYSIIQAFAIAIERAGDHRQRRSPGRAQHVRQRAATGGSHHVYRGPPHQPGAAPGDHRDQGRQGLLRRPDPAAGAAAAAAHLQVGSNPVGGPRQSASRTAPGFSTTAPPPPPTAAA